MIRSAANSPASPIGRLIRKIQCHDAACTSQPPSVGPSSGPTSAGIAMKLIADRNCSRGTERITASRPTGSSIAPPMPCSTRAATSQCSVGDSAQASEPRVNSTIAARNVRRVPTRSAIQPEAGMKLATASA